MDGKGKQGNKREKRGNKGEGETEKRARNGAVEGGREALGICVAWSATMLTSWMTMVKFSLVRCRRVVLIPHTSTCANLWLGFGFLSRVSTDPM